MPIVEVKSVTDNELVLLVSGRIDSSNSGVFDAALARAMEGHEGLDVVIDASGIEYISSAGLRVLLKIIKRTSLKIIEVNPDVYEILDMTGFVELMDAQKAYRVISVDGCEVIGQGANGKVYRIDDETIVKVYKNPDALPEIQRERELARTAFVLGIPTAIPYDVVRVGEGYGSVFELLNAKSFAKLLNDGVKTVDEIAELSVNLLKLIHGTEVKEGTLPEMKDQIMKWVTFLDGHLPAEQYDKLYSLVDAVPVSNMMMHGDCHIKNIMLMNGETLLIDMDTICTGNPIFELAQLHNAYVGFSEIDNEHIKSFLGIDYVTSNKLWHKILSLYLETEDEERIQEVNSKAMLIGTARIMRRAIRRLGEEELAAKQIEVSRKHIEELLPKIDTLLI